MWDHLNNALNQTGQRIISAIADFLPGLLAFLVSIFVALVLAIGLRFLIRRTLQGIGFDERIQQWGLTELAEWSPGRSPALLFSRLAFWGALLFGVLFGATALNATLVSQLVASFFHYLPNLIAALVVLLAGNFVARFLARGVLISAVNLQIQSARLLSLGVKWLVLVLTAAVVLDHLGIGRELVRISFAILFGGIVLALALAVGLGSKEMVSRTWQRQQTEQEETPQDFFRHL